MSVEVCYTSCACNQTPTAAHWGKNKLICFGSCNAVRIYDPNLGSGGKIIKTLQGHAKRVNSARWISGIDFECEVVSGSTDGTAIVWSYNNHTENYVPYILKGHEGNVNIVDGIYKGNDRAFAVVATVSIDSTLRIWIRKLITDNFQEAQCINFDYGIGTALRLSLLPQSSIVIMACGMDDAKINLYTEDCTENDFKLILREELKGHENWVRGLDFTLDGNNNLILASASQDTLIRLFKISVVNLEDNSLTNTANINYELILRKSRFKVGDVEYLVSLESILAGHEAWVYSVSWNARDFTLLSASLDKSMIIWEFNTESGLWLEKIRVGEVGGNTLGFYGGMFGPDYTTILAHGYHGAFHIWKHIEEINTWQPVVTVNGHFGEVVDLAWEPKGEFLVSISADQTTRIHAPWSVDEKHITWHEIARPQVHGYDMSCLAILSRYKFASGAEEKIIRTFKAPKNFVENFRRICKVEDDEEGESVLSSMESGPKGAAVPSLGLSNKAVYEDDNTEQATAKSSKEPYPEESHFTAVELKEPPTEETLLQNTLWPEIQKLYGHGYEVYALAANGDGSLLASACKSTTTEHAAVLLWDTSTWKQMQKLVSHSLTIAQLAFSPDSQHLLSVSRDRRWSLFSKNPDTNDFKLVATTDKRTGIHTRIIWCCAWSHDSKYFATGSRDGKVVAWTRYPDKASENVLGQYGSAGQHLELKGESVTALAFAPVAIAGFYSIAVGLESGIIHLYKWNVQEWKSWLIIDNSTAHHLAVRRLCFRPLLGEAGNKTMSDTILQLASCGSDHAVRIYNISVIDK